jgi:hypothetical protein
MEDDPFLQDASLQLVFDDSLIAFEHAREGQCPLPTRPGFAVVRWFERCLSFPENLVLPFQYGVITHGTTFGTQALLMKRKRNELERSSAVRWQPIL